MLGKLVKLEIKGGERKRWYNYVMVFKSRFFFVDDGGVVLGSTDRIEIVWRIYWFRNCVEIIF